MESRIVEIKSLLERDDHESAFDVFASMCKSDIDGACRILFGCGFYQKTKKEMLESLKSCLGSMTKTAIANRQSEQEIAIAENRLAEAIKGRELHRQGMSGAPVNSYPMTDDEFCDPHGVGEDVVSAAWDFEVEQRKQALLGLKNHEQ